MGDIKLSNGRGLFKGRRILDWCDVDSCAFDGVGCDAEPRTQCGGVSRRVVMVMLSHVGSELRVDNPAERHKPERKPCDR